MSTVTSIFIARAAAVLLAVSTLLPVLRAEALAVAPAAATVPERERLLGDVTQALASHFRVEGDLQVELLRPWALPTRSAAKWDVAVIEFPAALSSSLLLRVRLVADGAPAGDATLMLRAALWRDAWVSRQNLTIGAGFDASVLETRRVDLLRERDALPASIGDRTHVFARAVAAGRLLTWRDISRRPLVRKGDVVEVTAAEGTMLITLKGTAMENGAQGDVVTVRNAESRKDFTAQVVAENRVQVRF